MTGRIVGNWARCVANLPAIIEVLPIKYYTYSVRSLQPSWGLALLVGSIFLHVILAIASFFSGDIVT